MKTTMGRFGPPPYPIQPIKEIHPDTLAAVAAVVQRMKKPARGVRLFWVWDGSGPMDILFAGRFGRRYKPGTPIVAWGSTGEGPWRSKVLYATEMRRLKVAPGWRATAVRALVERMGWELPDEASSLFIATGATVDRELVHKLQEQRRRREEYLEGLRDITRNWTGEGDGGVRVTSGWRPNFHAGHRVREVNGEQVYEVVDLRGPVAFVIEEGTWGTLRPLPAYRLLRVEEGTSASGTMP